MRVAMLSYHTCPLATLGGKDTGGMNVYVHELTRHLGRMGVHVDVYTRSQDEHVPHVLHDLGYGNRVVHVAAGPEVPLPKEQLASFLPEFQRGVQEFAELKGLTYDVIHSHYWMSGIAGLGMRQVWQAPMIHMFHTLGLMKQRVARRPGEVEGDYRLQGERNVMQAADWVVAATPAERAQLQWLYEMDMSKVVVIPPGVDVSHFYPIPADEAKQAIGVRPCEQMLLFVGRIEALKGIDVLIEAIGILRKKGLSMCLAVIGGEVSSTNGGSAEMERLQVLREQAGLEDLVTFLGKKAQDTLPYYYSAAEAVVVPSHYESFGMVALEAMACGAPVVASQVGGLAYLVQDGVTGFTVEVDDAQALADRLALILTQPELRQKLSQQAAQIALGYAWETIAEKVLELYERAVRVSPGRWL